MTNTITWFQIATADTDAARTFYGELFGWTFQTDPNSGGRYHLISYPGAEQASGGIMDTAGEQPNHAIFVVQVADVAATATAAERLGGKTLAPVTTSPTGVVFAELADAAGNHFGVWTPPAG